MGQPHVRHDDKPDGGKERRGAEVEGAVEGSGVDGGGADSDQPAQSGQQHNRQDGLNGAGRLRAEQVHRAEAQCEGKGYGAGWGFGEVDLQVGAQAHQREGGLERQRGPGAEAADRAHALAHAAVQEVVDAPGAGHGGRQLGHAEDAGKEQDARQEVRQRGQAAGLRRREPGEQEEALS